MASTEQVIAFLLKASPEEIAPIARMLGWVTSEAAQAATDELRKELEAAKAANVQLQQELEAANAAIREAGTMTPPAETPASTKEPAPERTGLFSSLFKREGGKR